MGGFGGGSLFGSDITGGSGLDLSSLASSTFGGGAGGLNNFGGSGGVDPMTAAIFGGDPTGSIDATAAITGNYGGGADGAYGMSGPSSVGGVQSGSDGGAGAGAGAGTPAPAPPAPPASPPTVPAPVPPMVAAADTSTGPFSPSQQPNVPGPTGFTPNQYVQQNFGQMQPPGPTANQYVNQNTGQFQPPTSAAPAPMANWLPITADQASAMGGRLTPAKAQGTTPATDGTPDDGSQTATPPAASADTSPPTRGPDTAPPPRNAQTGGPGLGGMPAVGGIGNLIGDLMGIMSGNPQSLQALVGDVMRMGGPQMGGMMGGQGGQVATQGPYAGQPISQIPWATPEQIQQYRQTGQLPGRAPGQPGAGGAAGAGAPTRVPTTRVTASGQPTAQLPQPAPGSPGTIRSGWRAPDGGGQSGTPAAPTRKADGSFPTGRTEIAPIVGSALRGEGLTNNNAVNGIVWNMGEESGFDPTMRHPDQPKFGGEAHYAHGLTQEGGDNWNRYAQWLNGRDWRDPKLQAQFTAQNIKENYPQLWNKLMNARSPEEAAIAFASDYLKPARPYLIQRIARVRGGAMAMGQRYTPSAEALAYE